MPMGPSHYGSGPIAEAHLGVEVRGNQVSNCVDVVLAIPGNRHRVTSVSAVSYTHLTLPTICSV